MKQHEWGGVFFTVLSLSCGQLLFKFSALSIAKLPFFWSGAIKLLVNPWFICAIFIYGVATIAWVWLLRTVDLNVAYPFVALSFVIVPLASQYFFGEIVSVKYSIGYFLMVFVISIITQG